MAIPGWENWGQNLQYNYDLLANNATEGNQAVLSGAGWDGQSHAELNAGWQPTASAQAAVPAPTYTAPTATMQQPTPQSYGGYGGFSGTGMQVPIANDPMGGGGMDAFPYMQQQTDWLSKQYSDKLARDLQGIRSYSAGVGGLGGSRQGVAEAEAIAGSNAGFGGALANFLGDNYRADRALNTSSYATHRGLDLQQAGLAAQFLGQGTNLPWLPLNSASNIYGQYSGMNGGDSGSKWQQILGGLLSGAGLAGKMNLW